MKYLLSLTLTLLLFQIGIAQHPFPYLEDIYDYSWVENHGISEMTAETFSYEKGRFYLKALSEYDYFKGSKNNRLFKELYLKGHNVYGIFCRNADLFHHDLLHKYKYNLESFNFFYTRHLHMYSRMKGPTHNILDTEPITVDAKSDFKDRYQFKEFHFESERITRISQFFYDRSVSELGNKIEEIKQVPYKAKQIIDYRYNDDALIDQIEIVVSVEGNPKTVKYIFTIGYDKNQVPIEILEYKGEVEEANLVFKRLYTYEEVLK